MDSPNFLHSIKVASLKTGLTPHLIRVWERRYNAVSPSRTQTQRRMYSEAEIERLNLLRMLTEAGHSIGTIASLSGDDLKSLVSRQEAPARGEIPRQLASDQVKCGRVYVGRCIEAVAALDPVQFAKELEDAAVALGQRGFLIFVAAPLATEIGELWQTGAFGVAQEHFASAILKNFLGNLSRPYAPHDDAPAILIATPPGQLHEIGALLISATASSMGWKPIYLGASVCAVELANAARRCRPKIVALSVVYPPDDPTLGAELKRVRQLVPRTTEVLIGGRSAHAYAREFLREGALLCCSLEEFIVKLEEIRGRENGRQTEDETTKNPDGGVFRAEDRDR